MHTGLQLRYPLAITMWDFSWLERRWAGAGFENWDQALDELVLRGYDAVRIDAYPHLAAHDPRRVWELLPEWTQNQWGAPARCRVQVIPSLIRFLEKCAARGIKVALSTWFRQDLDNLRMRIKTPADLAAIWISTLDQINAAGLLDTLLYVDLCNEFPIRPWTPFLYASLPADAPDLSPADTLPRQWMTQALDRVGAAYPSLPLCVSFTNDLTNCRAFDTSALDLLEIHLWMAHFSEFYDIVGYHYERFDPVGYDHLALYGEKTYRERPDYWHTCLRGAIDLIAAWSADVNKPLITTECWGVIDYKDFPLLNWEWVKDLCVDGVRHASASGRWIALATSNFCAPQFVGMWRDVAWHQQLTDNIHHGTLPTG